jgi:hypothetical protein
MRRMNSSAKELACVVSRVVPWAVLVAYIANGSGSLRAQPGAPTSQGDTRAANESSTGLTLVSMPVPNGADLQTSFRGVKSATPSAGLALSSLPG